MEFINNKQVNLWRGSSEPPTKYHIWIKDNKLLLYDGEKWSVFVANFESLSELQKAVENLSNSTVNTIPIKNNPVLSSLDILIGQKLNNYTADTNLYTILSKLDSAYQEGYSIKIFENEDGSVTVSIGDHNFKIQTTGENLSVRTDDKTNTIIFSSNALTSISTEKPLEWTNDKKLIHQKSGVTSGSYGADSDQSEASVIKIPNITVDETGHINKIKDTNVTIRDYVEQLNPDDKDNVDRHVLLAYSNGTQTNSVRQADGMTYNSKSGDLKTKGSVEVGGGIHVKGGDVKVDKNYKIYGDVEGNVTGTATPKIHSSKIPEYGAASTDLYGHVIISDADLGEVAPLPSNTSTNPNQTTLDKGVQAVAASPLMVWKAVEKAKQYTREYFSDDFEEKDNKIYLRWEEIK